MRVFYNKQTGDIIGTVEGFYNRPETNQIKIIPEGMNEEDIAVEDINLGHELEWLAREFEDPRHPRQIHHHKMIKGKFYKMNDADIEKKFPKPKPDRPHKDPIADLQRQIDELKGKKT